MLVCIFLSIPVISAMLDEYEFNIVRDNADENCTICYGFDCAALNKPRCDYYVEIYKNYANIDDIEPEDIYLNDEVGNMMLQYVEKASTEPYEDCLPFVSQYTNCNKENICVECVVCSCDAYGKWNCSSVQRCGTEDPLVDHKALVVVMERLRTYKHLHSNERLKRSTNEINDNKRISYEDLLEWFYGIKGIENQEKNRTEMARNKTNMNEENDVSKNVSSNTNLEPDLLSFDDLLNSVIGDDNRDLISNHSEAILYKNNDPISFDLLKEIDINDVTETNEFKLPEGKTKSESVTMNTAFTKYTNVNENYIFSFNEGNENTINLKKRDVTSVANATDEPLLLNYNNTIDKMEELQKNVVISLSKIVNEKQNELDKLRNMKENLILYLKSFGNISISNVSNDSKYDDQLNIHLYHFEAIPQQEDLRKHDPNILERYLKKLKRDIYEVIKDIAGIQRLSNTSVPHDISVLVRAMKYYVNKENKKIYEKKHNKAVNFRKQLNTQYQNENNQLVDIIIDILEVLDKDATAGDILITLSRDLKRILTRVIKIFYTDDFDISSSKVINPKYSIIEYLNSIGNKWQNLPLEIGQNSIHEHIYSLKFLYIVLSKDILKMNDALKLIEFANNRRMATNGELLGEKVVFKMANNLHEVKNRIKQMIKLQPKGNFKNKSKNPVKKKSIFQKIKNMLRSSKKKLKKIFNKNVSKNEVVKQLARKRIDEINKQKLSEYEEIMQRWQNNLNRNKRSAGFRKFINNIKNIFAPRYSRSKKKNNGTKLTTKRSKHHKSGKKKNVTSTTRKTVLFKNTKHNHTKVKHS